MTKNVYILHGITVMCIISMFRSTMDSLFDGGRRYYNEAEKFLLLSNIIAVIMS